MWQVNSKLRGGPRRRGCRRKRRPGLRREPRAEPVRRGWACPRREVQTPAGARPRAGLRPGKRAGSYGRNAWPRCTAPEGKEQAAPENPLQVGVEPGRLPPVSMVLEMSQPIVRWRPPPPPPTPADAGPDG